MEAREQVEETEDVHELKAMLSRNSEQQQEIVAQISQALRSKAYADAVRYTTQLTYLAKLEHEIRMKLPHEQH
jgi:DnaJ-domain-containing protein 1